VINKQIRQFPLKYINPLRKVAIGWGVHETVGDECKEAGIKKALITTTGLKGTGIVDEIVGILHHCGISTEIYDKVTSNPKDYEVMEAYQVFKDAQCDGVVSVGGGSSHDCGKGVRAVVANGGRFICDMALSIDPPWMEVMKTLKPYTYPQVFVTTTAGTGSECTLGGLITNTKLRAKQVIQVAEYMPTAGLVDPLLVRTMPQSITAWSGWDAITHAFEGLVGKLQVPASLAMMREVVKMVSENLREFTY
jgi:formaldehyde dismutase / methanol dehydrogenase